jgi:general secretion pathway protein D
MTNEKWKDRRKSPVKFSTVIFLIFVFAILRSPDLFGARVAGEEGVSPATPQERAVGQDRPKTVAPKQPVTPEVRPRPLKTDVVKKKTVPGEKIGDRFVNIDFDNVDISLFIKFISELTGKNFVIDDKVRGKVTIISPKKISVDEAYKVFESVLEVHGFTAVPSGKVIKIVPLHDARSKSIETRLKAEATAPEDKVVTQLIPLEYASPDELKKLFTPLVSKNSVIISYPPTRTMIVTDVLSNLQRILKIVKAIDVVGVGEEITVIPVQHADVSNLAKSLDTVFTAGLARAKKVPGAVSVKIVPDERTNVLIIVAAEDDVARIKHLVRLLDIETPRGKGDIHVYYLQNANAENLAKVLTSLPAGNGQVVKGKASSVLSRGVHIVADNSTNALVITADRDDYSVLEGVIEKLDIPRAMVYIEALIMEVNVDKSFSIGVEWEAFKDIGSWDGQTLGAFGAYSGSDFANSTRVASGIFPSGLSLGVAGESITIGDLVFPNVGAIIQAYQRDEDVHILSTPQILTTDNEEAEIKVGENVPFVTRQETTEALRDYTSYEYKDVGVNLKITPQINQERFVRLDIFQELTKLILEGGAVPEAPRTFKRSAETTVIVKDGQTVVIGGLIGEDTTGTDYRVPCLGDIPVIGWLFKYWTERNTNTNLYIFITPHIIENSSEAKAIYEEKREQIDTVREKSIKLYKRGKASNEKPETSNEE